MLDSLAGDDVGAVLPSDREGRALLGLRGYRGRLEALGCRGFGHHAAQEVEQGFQPFPRGGGNDEHRDALGLQRFLDAFQIGLRLGDVHLVERRDPRAYGQFRAVVGQLGLDGLPILQRITTFEAARQVHQVHQNLGAFQMPQELVAEARPLVGALDQARHVGKDDVLGFAEAHDAQVGFERGERVIGNLGPRRGHV